MKNKEKYKMFFGKYEMCDISSPWYKDVCHGNICKGCVGRFIEWCEQEAIPDITDLEREVLKRIEQTFKYIARDKDGRLFIYYGKPQKVDDKWGSSKPFKKFQLTGLFDWITFDDAEPWCIDDLVKRPGG